MSNIGLDHPHIEEHFAANGLCQCPCSECTARTTKLCWCPDCPCMTSDGDLHATLQAEG